MEIPRTTVQAKSHRFKNLAILIYLMLSAGMGLMFVTIYLGLPVMVSLLALVVPMFLIVGLTSGKTEYVIDDRFLEKKLTTFLRKKQIDKKYTWNDINSFKEGKDLNRQLQEYSYVEIHFKDRTTWQITDQVDKPGFEKFREVFLEAVNAHNEPVVLTAPATVSAVGSSSAQPSPDRAYTAPREQPGHQIIQQKTFYETVWAKVFFWAMALFTSGIMGFLFLNPQYNSFTTGFRLSFVIIPGMLYLCYRVYIKGR